MSSPLFLAFFHLDSGRYTVKLNFLQRKDGNKIELIFLPKIMLLDLVQTAAKKRGIGAKFHV